MIHFIYGASGCGKTHAIEQYLKSDANASKKAFLIVPEQETVAVERSIVSSLPASSQLNIEVLNFSRLCNRIFRTYGGISYNFATPAQRALIMWNTIRELAPILEEYRANDINDFSLTKKMLSVNDELKAYCISPEKLEATSQKIPAESSLYGKLRDISLIYSAYNAKLNEHFSDSADDISHAIEILKNHNFFEGSNVYFDSFAGFTKQEFNFIKRTHELADNIYITLPIPSPNDRSVHLESLAQTLNKLKKHLDRNDYEEIYLTENHRTSKDDLKYLQENIWHFDAPKFPQSDAPSNIKAYICESPYSEAEIVASEICRAVQGNLKYSEIAILSRDVEKYRGVLDTTLEKYGIPYFMSEKTDLMTKPLSKFLFSALKIKESNFRAQNVIAYLKSGFVDVDPFDVDIFEDYVHTWNIRNNKFFDEKWTMNPDGYSAKFTKRGEKILKTANEVKNKVIPPLALYFTHLDAAENVRQMCRATIDFLSACNITQRVRDMCKENLERKDKKSANEDMKLYSTTLDILYDLSNIYGDEQFTFEEFYYALSLMFSQSDIGTIPTSSDEVLVGSASMLRPNKIKLAILFGLNEGEFPASINDNGVFTDVDKEMLEEFDITLSSSSTIRSSEELFFVYRALSSPKESLILTCSLLSSDASKQRPSIVFNRLDKLFPNIAPIKESEIDVLDKIWNVESGKQVYPQIKKHVNSDKIKDILTQKDDEGADYTAKLDIPLSQRKCEVSSTLASEIFGKKISLSQSKLEKYVLCGFDYYCTYVLQLRDRKSAAFKFNDIGTFIHYILEMFMKEISKDKKLNLSISDKEIDEILERTVSNYLLEVFGEDYSISNRNKHLFLRLNQLSFMIAKNLIAEFKESDFFPSYFEVDFGRGDYGFKSLEFKLKDDTCVSLRGTIDRIDTYKKDGNVYIRVVDYKTGSKEFSFSDIKDGINMQLLIYLFSTYKTSDKEEDKIAARKRAKELGCDDGGEILPAGIQYLSSHTPAISLESVCDDEQIMSLIQNKFSRSGLLLNDKEILTAMNHNLDPQIVSKTKTDDDGNLVGKSLVTSNGFDEIYDELAQTIVKIAQNLKDGKADAIPLVRDKKVPCQYCKMKAICRASLQRR